MTQILFWSHSMFIWKSSKIQSLKNLKQYINPKLPINWIPVISTPIIVHLQKIVFSCICAIWKNPGFFSLTLLPLILLIFPPLQANPMIKYFQSCLLFKGGFLYTIYTDSLAYTFFKAHFNLILLDKIMSVKVI